MNINVGDDYGIYHILSYEYLDKYGRSMYHVRCNICGWETTLKSNGLVRLKQTCCHKNKAGQYINRSGAPIISDKRLANIFKSMKERCYNSNEKSYKWYGAKGIKICQEWLDNPNKFEQWAFDNGYSDTLTIDRIDENCDYCPENCRWITAKNNARYKSTTNIISVNGESHTGREWAEILKLGTNTINSMLRNYHIDNVITFIKKRIANMSVHRKSHETWMEAYNIT